MDLNSDPRNNNNLIFLHILYSPPYADELNGGRFFGVKSVRRRRRPSVCCTVLTQVSSRPYVY